MKSKRKKAAKSPPNVIKPPALVKQSPAFEQCWYCDLNADAGAQATIVLTKFEDGFQYFASVPEERKLALTQVQIPRCLECQTAHDKVGDPFWMILLICFTAVALVGIYLGIFTKTLSLWIYLLIGLAVSGAVVGIAVGVSRNLFMLPKNIKNLHDVRNQKEVETLLLKGWKVKL